MAQTVVRNVCLGLIIVGSVAIIAGSMAPSWAELERAGKASFGPWYHCMDTSVFEIDGKTYEWVDSDDDISGWFYAFRVLEGTATLLALALVIISLTTMFGKPDSTRPTAGLGLAAGIVGVTATVMYYVKMPESLENSVVTKDDAGWAFYVSCCGSSFLAVISIILLVLSFTHDNKVEGVQKLGESHPLD